MKLICLLVVTTASIALCAAIARAGDAPPKIFIDKGACPFECCTYRDWTVGADTVLYDQPNGNKRVDTAVKGETVRGVTGDVYVHPTPFTVAFEHGRFHVGDTAYLLTYEGEGVSKVWLDGTISEEEVYFVADKQDWGYAGGKRLTCTHPSARCWGRMEKENESDWWVLIKTPRGSEGWTRQTDHFGNMDACGG
jgi:hypothetical protein